MFVIEGVFDGKTIIPDEPLKVEPGRRLRMRVFVVPTEEQVVTLHQALLRSGENATDDPEAPKDGAANFRHYLYGEPKQHE